MPKKTWVVYDSVSKTQSQPVNEEQLQIAILRMDEKDWERFYLWTTGWENWQPLGRFLKSGQAEFIKISNKGDSELDDTTIKTAILENISPEHKRRRKKENTITKSVTLIKMNEDTLFGFSKHGVDLKTYEIEDLDLDKTGSLEKIDVKNLRTDESYKRRAERHELKIEILLMAKNGKIFKSYSKNISLSGTVLADNIPSDFHKSAFEVVIINKYSSSAQRSRLHLKGAAVGEGNTRRMSFDFSSDNLKNRLFDLLKDYLTQNKAKSAS